MTPYDAIILAGGAARRFGGIDKVELVVGSGTLLSHAVRASSEAQQTIVVGPRRPLTESVRWTREEPAGSGPAAALAAGLACAEAAVVVLLAADLPFISAGVVRQLARAAAESGGGLAVDETGHPQWLLSAWRTAVLRAALAGTTPAGASLRTVLGSLPCTQLAVDAWVAIDCDTPADLEVARSR